MKCGAENRSDSLTNHSVKMIDFSAINLIQKLGQIYNIFNSEIKHRRLSVILILSVLKNKEFIGVFVCSVFHLDMTDKSEETVKISLTLSPSVASCF